MTCVSKYGNVRLESLYLRSMAFLKSWICRTGSNSIAVWCRGSIRGSNLFSFFYGYTMVHHNVDPGAINRGWWMSSRTLSVGIVAVWGPIVNQSEVKLIQGWHTYITCTDTEPWHVYGLHTSCSWCCWMGISQPHWLLLFWCYWQHNGQYDNFDHKQSLNL